MTALSAEMPAAPAAVAERALLFQGVKNVPLNFQLGELRVLSVARRVAVYGCTNRGMKAYLETLPALHGADGYLIRALPAPLALDTHLRSQWTARLLRAYPRHLVDLTAGYDAYLAKFSGKTRSTLKRKLRKFQDLSGGKIDWKEYRSPEELRAFLPIARDLSARTYQQRLLNAGLPESERFAAEAQALAARDLVRAYILFLQGKAVSYLYLPVEGSSVIYAYLGYDPEAAEHSPGTVLQLLAMERLFAERRFTLFDFTEGAGQHKELFATHTEQCVDMLILKRNASTLALTTAHGAFVHSERALTRLLDSLGIKRRLKKLVRAFASRGD